MLLIDMFERALYKRVQAMHTQRVLVGRQSQAGSVFQANPIELAY